MVDASELFWCPGCKSHVARELFAKNKNRPNGLHAYCLACNRRKQAAERARRGDDYREMRRRYRATEGGRAAYRRYRTNHPGKAYAHLAAQHAVAEGKLIRPASCEQCSRVGIIDSHHDDYAKPLEVRWLCRWCHQEWHRINGEAANADTLPPGYGLVRNQIAEKAKRVPLVAAMRAAGMKQKDIAAHFGVTQATICHDLKQSARL